MHTGYFTENLMIRKVIRKMMIIVVQFQSSRHHNGSPPLTLTSAQSLRLLFLPAASEFSSTLSSRSAYTTYETYFDPILWFVVSLCFHVGLNLTGEALPIWMKQERESKTNGVSWSDIYARTVISMPAVPFGMQVNVMLTNVWFIVLCANVIATSGEAVKHNRISGRNFKNESKFHIAPSETSIFFESVP